MNPTRNRSWHRICHALAPLSSTPWPHAPTLLRNSRGEFDLVKDRDVLLTHMLRRTGRFPTGPTGCAMGMSSSESSPGPRGRCCVAWGANLSGTDGGADAFAAPAAGWLVVAPLSLDTHAPMTLFYVAGCYPLLRSSQFCRIVTKISRPLARRTYRRWLSQYQDVQAIRHSTTFCEETGSEALVVMDLDDSNWDDPEAWRGFDLCHKPVHT